MTADPKSQLRARLRARRRELASAIPGAADLAAGLLPLDRLPSFQVFAAYHPMGAEMDPRPLIRRLTAAGGQASLPVVIAPASPLEFRAWDPADAMQVDAAAIPSPPPHAKVLSPDLVITPLLAFDRRGGRLGQGGGYYDRTLENLRAIKPVFVLGLAYAGQEVETLACEPHDQRLDAILTETGYTEVIR